MQDKEIKDAIASILKKEVGALGNVIPLIWMVSKSLARRQRSWCGLRTVLSL